ncbi:MAG: hypothetical protein JXB49_33865 [Bacteroidales bacterium]|nr:hypothetical protein [Bacteroidales bacterium]
MSENSITFTHREVAEALIKKQDLHEGLWGISIEFSLGGANISQGPDNTNLTPAAIIPVTKIGIQKFSKPNSLTVDAAEINPPKENKKN